LPCTTASAIDATSVSIENWEAGVNWKLEWYAFDKDSGGASVRIVSATAQEHRSILHDFLAGGEIELMKKPVQTTEGASRRYIAGSLKNSSGKMIEYAYARFNLYDEEGNLLGNAQSSMTSSLGWKAGANWEYKAPVFNSQAIDRCKLMSVSGRFAQ